MSHRIMTIEELVRGPNQGDGPDMSAPWRIVGAKTAGGLVKPRAYVTLREEGGGPPGLAKTLQEWAMERLEPYRTFSSHALPIRERCSG